MNRRKRVNKFSVLYALFAIKIFSAIVAQRTLHEIDRVSFVWIVELGRELKVRWCRARTVGAARRHGRFTTSKDDDDDDPELTAAADVIIAAETMDARLLSLIS